MNFKTRDNNDIKIILDEPVVVLDEFELCAGKSYMPIKDIYINNKKLSKSKKSYKNNSSFEFGYIQNLENPTKGNVYLNLTNELAQKYFQIVGSNENISVVNIEAPEEFISVFSEKITKNCLRALNNKISERYNIVYQSDILLPNNIAVEVKRSDSNLSNEKFKVNIQGVKLSTITYKAETVLYDADEYLDNYLDIQMKDYRVDNNKWIMELINLKLLLQELTEKLEYEEDYLEKELFNI